MDRKFLILILPVFAVILVSGCTHTQPGDGVDNTPDEADRFTLSQVAEHSQRSDCWLVLHGNVYDVTSWIPTHPGGEAILEGCGTDASELFETRPMGSGTPHSQRARDLLPNYYIGDLE
jgi:cytochrome b involved in lipid metabolism